MSDSAKITANYFCVGAFLIFIGSILLCALGFTVVLPFEVTRTWPAVTCQVVNSTYDPTVCSCDDQLNVFDTCVSKYPCLQIYVAYTVQGADQIVVTRSHVPNSIQTDGELITSVPEFQTDVMVTSEKQTITGSAIPRSSLSHSPQQGRRLIDGTNGVHQNLQTDANRAKDSRGAIVNGTSRVPIPFQPVVDHLPEDAVITKSANKVGIQFQPAVNQSFNADDIKASNEDRRSTFKPHLNVRSLNTNSSTTSSSIHFVRATQNSLGRQRRSDVHRLGGEADSRPGQGKEANTTYVGNNSMKTETEETLDGVEDGSGSIIVARLYRSWDDSFHQQCTLTECGDETWNVKESRRFKSEWGQLGQNFTCFYNPHRPNMAIIERINTVAAVHAIVWPGLCLLTGITLWIGLCIGCWTLGADSSCKDSYGLVSS